MKFGDRFLTLCIRARISGGLRSPFGVASLLLASILVVWLGLHYLLRNEPTAEQSCAQTCAFQGRNGKLVNVYSQVQTAGNGGRNKTTCVCW
jgi:hypothetical protein